MGKRSRRRRHQDGATRHEGHGWSRAPLDGALVEGVLREAGAAFRAGHLDNRPRRRFRRSRRRRLSKLGGRKDHRTFDGHGKFHLRRVRSHDGGDLRHFHRRIGLLFGLFLLRLRLDFRRFRRLNDLNRHEFLGPLRELLLKFGRVEAGETDDEEQKTNGVDVSQFSVRVAVGSRKAELSDVRAKGVTARIKRARCVHGRRGLCCS